MKSTAASPVRVLCLDCTLPVRSQLMSLFGLLARPIYLRMCPIFPGAPTLGKSVALRRRRFLHVLKLNKQRFVGAFCFGMRKRCSSRCAQ